MAVENCTWPVPVTLMTYPGFMGVLVGMAEHHHPGRATDGQCVNVLDGPSRPGLCDLFNLLCPKRATLKRNFLSKWSLLEQVMTSRVVVPRASCKFSGDALSMRTT